MAETEATSKRSEPEEAAAAPEEKKARTEEAKAPEPKATEEAKVLEEAKAEAGAEAVKRKEPEVAEKKEEPKLAEAAKAEGQSDAKRLKPTGPDPKMVRKQVEYYLSDENLRHDKFFHEKISADSEGWLEMSCILSCNKMKAMKTTKEDVMAALKESKIELKEGAVAVRRPGNAGLPNLEAKPQHHAKKNQLHAHDGGAVVAFKNVPAEQSWKQVKEALQVKLPGKSGIWHASEVNDKGTCFVVCSPFEGDLAWFQALELELGGAKLKCEVCYAEQLQQVLRSLPKHVRDKREKESKKKTKERSRPIVVGNQRFMNIGGLRGKVKEIINSRSDGESLKPEGTDFNLIKALIGFHPKGKEKSEGMVGLKVAKSTHGENRCFFMVRADGSEEDVSMMKCITAVEMNPPYVTVEKASSTASSKAEKASSAASSKADEAGKKPEEKPAEKPSEKPAEKPAEETPAAEKPAEKAAEIPAEKPVEAEKPVAEPATA